MNVQIFNEDCRETMKNLEPQSVDVVLTSPFYNTSGTSALLNEAEISKFKGNNRNHPQQRYDIHVDNMTSDEYRDFSLELFKGFDRILKPNGVVLYNISYGVSNTTDLFLVISDLITKSNFTVADVICWKKPTAIPNNINHNRLTRIWEFVFVLCRKAEINTFHMNKKVVHVSDKGQNFYENIQNFIEAPNNDGPCDYNKATYSSDLCIQLLTWYAPSSATVYDPFNGTGTTGVACKMMGFDYIGSEISPTQVKFSLDRINGVDVYSKKKTTASSKLF